MLCLDNNHDSLPLNGRLHMISFHIVWTASRYVLDVGWSKIIPGCMMRPPLRSGQSSGQCCTPPSTPASLRTPPSYQPFNLEDTSLAAVPQAPVTFVAGGLHHMDAGQATALTVHPLDVLHRELHSVCISARLTGRNQRIHGLKSSICKLSLGRGDRQLPSPAVQGRQETAQGKCCLEVCQ